MSYKSPYAFEYKHIAKVDTKAFDKALKFCEGYKDFIGKCKTERECTAFIENIAKKNGYKEFDINKIKKSKSGLKEGDKYYFNNRGKSIILLTIGKENLEKGVNFVISHIDSPRLDLKANPLYENTEVSYFKTHYYGGIRKYQWPTVPLAMHGRIMKKDGSFIDLAYGEKEDEPKFMITDLLPHLAQEQSERKLKDGIKGEELNIVVGSIPFVSDNEKEEIKDAVKEKTLMILNKLYGITEKDFVRAEIEFVPATKPSDIGFDKSMIAAYGQDDRVCAYTALMAEIDAKNINKTSVTVFTDKEEIGSEGNTGMISNYLFDFMEDLADVIGIKARNIYKNSVCLSSDVNSAFDPTFSDVFELKNSSYINKGVVFTKFTGHRGKAEANDASCETMAKIIKIMDDAKVVWQTGELGKVDIGGGGTIAKYVSQRNVDTVDLGVPVLAMHSPYELTSKLDVYETFLAYKAFISSK